MKVSRSILTHPYQPLYVLKKNARDSLLLRCVPNILSNKMLLIIEGPATKLYKIAFG